MSEQPSGQEIIVAAARPSTMPVLVIPQQADSDAKLVTLWLHDRGSCFLVVLPDMTALCLDLPAF
jgi:hypothetical protein